MKNNTKENIIERNQEKLAGHVRDTFTRKINH
jgi:hypothetical protein